MCEGCMEATYWGTYTETDGTVWHYRTIGLDTVERSRDMVDWRPVTPYVEAEMSANHLDFISSMR